MSINRVIMDVENFRSPLIILEELLSLLPMAHSSESTQARSETKNATGKIKSSWLLQLCHAPACMNTAKKGAPCHDEHRHEKEHVRPCELLLFWDACTCLPV